MNGDSCQSKIDSRNMKLDGKQYRDVKQMMFMPGADSINMK